MGADFAALTRRNGPPTQVQRDPLDLSRFFNRHGLPIHRAGDAAQIVVVGRHPNIDKFDGGRPRLVVKTYR